MFLAGSAKSGDRITTSVKWTETYKDRVQTLLGSGAAYSPTRSNSAIRAILLQDCWGGKKALALPVGRNPGSTQGFVISVLGNNEETSKNTFKLQVLDGDKVISTSNIIPQISTNTEMAKLFTAGTSRAIGPEIYLGNPFDDEELIEYGDVKVKDNIKSTLLGLWYVYIDKSVADSTLNMQVFLDEETNLTGLTAISCEKTEEILYSEITFVTDIDYRPETYCWKKGTIVTCLPFDDIGYGIIRGSSRDMNSFPPAN
jgi:hypothetical protein